MSDIQLSGRSQAASVMLRSAGFRCFEFVASREAGRSSSEASTARSIDARGYWLGMGASFFAGISGVLLLYLRFEDDALFLVGSALLAVCALLGRATTSVFEQRVASVLEELGLANAEPVAAELVAGLWRHVMGAGPFF